MIIKSHSHIMNHNIVVQTLACVNYRRILVRTIVVMTFRDSTTIAQLKCARGSVTRDVEGIGITLQLELIAGILVTQRVSRFISMECSQSSI